MIWPRPQQHQRSHSGKGCALKALGPCSARTWTPRARAVAAQIVSPPPRPPLSLAQRTNQSARSGAARRRRRHRPGAAEQQEQACAMPQKPVIKGKKVEKKVAANKHGKGGITKKGERAAPCLSKGAGVDASACAGSPYVCVQHAARDGAFLRTHAAAHTHACASPRRAAREGAKAHQGAAALHGEQGWLQPVALRQCTTQRIAARRCPWAPVCVCLQEITKMINANNESNLASKAETGGGRLKAVSAWLLRILHSTERATARAAKQDGAPAQARASATRPQPASGGTTVLVERAPPCPWPSHAPARLTRSTLDAAAAAADGVMVFLPAAPRRSSRLGRRSSSPRAARRRRPSSSTMAARAWTSPDTLACL